MRFTSLIFVVGLAMLLACRQHAAPLESEVSHTHASATLSLNEGARWKTDAGTRAHATALLQHTQQFLDTNKLSGYRQLAATLQQELDALVKECRMTGPEHEALHHWLEPVLETVSEMSRVQELAAGKMLFRKLERELQQFPQYFY